MKKIALLVFCIAIMASFTYAETSQDYDMNTGPKSTVYDQGDDTLAYKIDSGDCATTCAIVAGAFHGATQPGTDDARLQTLIDGNFAANGLTVIANDYGYANPSLTVEFDLGAPKNLNEIRIFSGHDGDGSRAFINARIEIDKGKGYQVLEENLKAGEYGDPLPGDSTVAVARLFDNKGYLAGPVEKVRIGFYCVSNSFAGGFFAEPGSGDCINGTILKEVDILCEDACIAEVNGVDNPPTTFATIADAWAYLQANCPGAPKKINITTNGPIVETVSTVFQTTDTEDVMLIGDADMDTNPCTIIASPTVAADMEHTIASSYGVLFEINLGQCEFWMDDLILMPDYRGDNERLPGGYYGCYPYIVDEHPDCGGDSPPYSFEAERIVIGGSKAGNVLAADVETNEFAVTTKFAAGTAHWSTSGAPLGKNYVRLKEVEVYNSDYTGIDFNSDNTDIVVQEGCISAWSAEEAISFRGCDYSTISIEGTPAKRCLGRGSGQYDTDEEGFMAYTNSGAIGTTEFSKMAYCDIIENGGEVDFNELVPDLTDNCFFAYNCQNEDYEWNCGNFRIGATNSTLTTKTMTNCTLHDLQAATADSQSGITFGWYDTLNMVLECENVIISGADDTGVSGRSGAVNTVIMDYCALVGQGTEALATEIDDDGAGDLTVHLVNINRDDPDYQTTTFTYGDSNFLAVKNVHYGASGPGGNPLKGAGVYLGGGVPVELSVFEIE